MIEYDGGLGFFSDILKLPTQMLQTTRDVVTSPAFQQIAVTGANTYLASQAGMGVSPQMMGQFVGGYGAPGGNSQQQYWPENQRATGALLNMMGPRAQFNPAGMMMPSPPAKGGISPVMLLGGAALLVGVVLVLRKK